MKKYAQTRNPNAPKPGKSNPENVPTFANRASRDQRKNDRWTDIKSSQPLSNRSLCSNGKENPVIKTNTLKTQKIKRKPN